MNTVIISYDISSKTLALLPARKIDYDTIVIKENETKYVQQPSFDLIKEACFRGDWTTYEGRRDAVIKHTNFIQKTPIPIDIRKGVYFFPTHSPKNINNIWIAFHQIKLIGKVPSQERTKQAQSIVFFKNGQSLVLDITYHALNKQYERTLECVYRIEGSEGVNRIYPQ